MVNLWGGCFGDLFVVGGRAQSARLKRAAYLNTCLRRGLRETGATCFQAWGRERVAAAGRQVAARRRALSPQRYALEPRPLRAHSSPHNPKSFSIMYKKAHARITSSPHEIRVSQIALLLGCRYSPPSRAHTLDGRAVKTPRQHHSLSHITHNLSSDELTRG